jgi:leader peptidase (prepilin peptidase)/N-methyltransferase
MPILLAASALLGLAVGSFLNVVIHRVPRAESLVRPGSHCPACGHAIRTRHNLPLVGWLVLRGRCADCRSPISARYPLVELATAGLFVAVTMRLAGQHLLPALPAYLYLVAVGVALSLIDLDCHRLPDAIVLPSYAVLGLCLLAASAWQHDWWALVRALAGGVALFLLYFALAFAYPAGMGFGDVKLAGLLGGVLGFISLPTLLVGAFAAFLLGGLAGGVVILSGRGSGKTALPFGPFMVGGTLLALFAAEPIADLYVTYALHA